MPVSHARAVATEIATVTADPDVVGLLLCGSAARGDALPGSDLDLRLFLRDGAVPRPYRAADEDGLFVERAYRTVAEARERLRTRPMEVYPYREGVALYDPEGAVAGLIAEAAALYDAFRVDPEAKRASAYWLESTERKLAAALAAGETERAAFVATTGAWPILEGLFLAADRPCPPSGAVRAHLPDACARAGIPSGAIMALWEGTNAEGRALAALGVVRALLPRLRGDVSG